MNTSIRYIQIFLVASMALYMSVISFNNIFDFNSNWQIVRHILSMDTTFQDPDVYWRAISNPTIQHIAYLMIILWEVITAILCWLGVIKLFQAVNQPTFKFNEAKKFAYIGLSMGALLFLIGFLIIGGEWFMMWQSKIWNGQVSATRMFTLFMLVLIFLRGSK